VKKSNTKPVSASGGKIRRKPLSKKKKRRRKPVTEDRIGAVLIAAVLITAAVMGSLLFVYFRSTRTSNEAVAPETAVNVATGKEAAPEAGQADTKQGTNTPTELPAEPLAGSPARLPAGTPVGPLARETPVKTSAPTATGRPVQPAPPAEKTLPVKPLPAAALSSGGITERPPVPSRGVLVFVIDDAGYSLGELEPFLAFPGPLTIAVLPGLPHSAEAARRIRAAGKEVLLHQPMEAIGGQDPGPGSIRAGMNSDEIRSIINRNLDELGPVAGINNHEGSRITMDEGVMETVLALCREKGLLFLDSRTTAETAAPKAARLLGMNIIQRDIFLDNSTDRKSINGYIDSGLVKAEKNGSAVYIGHVRTAELAPLLTELYPSLTAQGYTFSLASELINKN